MRRFLIALLLALFLVPAPTLAGQALPPFDPATVPAAPDYEQPENWLALPDDPDAHPVDVFWVYPTVLSDREHWLMDPAAPESGPMAAPTLARQASVFEGQANVYAPLYRQMNLAGLALPEEQRNGLLEYGKKDVWRAFNHYLNHHNQGRPFILAGHSQGSNLLTLIAVENWGALAAEHQLVAAYLIGWSITGQDLKSNPTLAMCTSADQVNCFISYNTVADGCQKLAPTIKKGAIVTNPLTWTTSGEAAPATLNLGARFFNEDGTSKVYPHFTPAQVKDSGLVVKPADPALVAFDSKAFPKGVYHPFDYSLFYENIRANAARRIKAFLDKRR
jgi:hypothetical protein